MDAARGDEIPYGEPEKPVHIANSPKRLYQIQLENERKYARRKDAEMGIRPDDDQDEDQ
ncbi:MAG: hypothetical protein RL671_173 [Pseudomonadota bacterium]